ncbi:MAG: hypothetical protein IJN82_03440 [Clostridia bacterium]|nr:hypothetical protein [Clostridia bacterium]
MKTKHLSFLQLLLPIAILLSAIVTWRVTGTLMDSDAASELVLSHHLSENGGILSSDWIYSTELRVANTQLVFAPLFLLFNDWHMVRFLGAMILQLLLVGSFYLFIRLMGADRRIFHIGAPLMLLPISVCYGRIVLYHSFYVPHIALSFLLVGLIFHFFKSGPKRNLATALKLLLLMGLSLIGGLGGVRQLMITHLPALLAIGVCCFLEDRTDPKGSIRKRTRLIPLGIALASAVFSYLGLLINTNVLAEQYTYMDYSEKLLDFFDFSRFGKLLYGFFHHFGFRAEGKLISLVGALSMLGFFLGLYALIRSVRHILNHKGDVRQTALRGFLIFHLIVMMMVFFFTTENYYHVLYLIFVLCWAIPLLITELLEAPNHLSPLNLRRLLPYAAVVLLAVNGIVNILYLCNDDLFEQRYEGLTAQNKQQMQQIEPAATYLEAEGYDLGYATFWNSNVMTELSNGAIRTVNLRQNQTTGQLYYYDWLTLRSNRTLTDAKRFLLLQQSERPLFESTGRAEGLTVLYEDDYYIAYDLPAPERILG